MSRCALLSLLAVSFVLTPATAATARKAGSWVRDVDQALERAQSQQRPVLLFVSMDRCKYCQKMAQTTFRDPQVLRTLGTQYVPTVIKNTERPDLMRQLQIQSFPTTLVVSPDGDVLHEIKGYVEPVKFQQQLLQLAGQPRSSQAVASRRAAAPANAVPATGRSLFSFASFRRSLSTGPTPGPQRPTTTRPFPARPTSDPHQAAHTSPRLPFGLERLFQPLFARR